MPQVSKDKLVKGKLSASIKTDDGAYLVIKTQEVYNTSAQKSLEDARGYVVAEYQDYLEKKWNEQLRQKYPLKVENNVFKAMVH